MASFLQVSQIRASTGVIDGLLSVGTVSSDTVSAGTVTAGFFYGDGSQLTSLPASNPFDQSLCTGDSPTFANLTATCVSASVFYGDASYLTGIPNPFNQCLNTYDYVGFSQVNSALFYGGDFNGSSVYASNFVASGVTGQTNCVSGISWLCFQNGLFVCYG